MSARLRLGDFNAALFELMRSNHARAATNAFQLARFDMSMTSPSFALSVRFRGWATAASGVLAAGLDDMRRGVEQLREQTLMFDGPSKIALAEAEARRTIDRAIAILDEAWRRATAPGHRASKQNCIEREARSC